MYCLRADKITIIRFVTENGQRNTVNAVQN